MKYEPYRFLQVTSWIASIYSFPSIIYIQWLLKFQNISWYIFGKQIKFYSELLLEEGHNRYSQSFTVMYIK